MGMPTKDFTGQTATITMAEFRSKPGEVLDFARHGMEVTVTKNGKPVAVLGPVREKEKA